MATGTRERTTETATAKAALVKAGYRNVSARHGTGTAWGWLSFKVTADRPADCYCAVPTEVGIGRTGTCPRCRYAWTDQYNRAINTVADATGRHFENNRIGGDVTLEYQRGVTVPTHRDRSDGKH